MKCGPDDHDHELGARLLKMLECDTDLSHPPARLLLGEQTRRLKHMMKDARTAAMERRLVKKYGRR